MCTHWGAVTLRILNTSCPLKRRLNYLSVLSYWKLSFLSKWAKEGRLWFGIQLFCILIPSSTKFLNFSPNLCFSISEWQHHPSLFLCCISAPSILQLQYGKRTLEESCTISSGFLCAPSLPVLLVFLDHLPPSLPLMLPEWGESNLTALLSVRAPTGAFLAATMLYCLPLSHL